MTKIKIIRNDNMNALCACVNEFIRDKKVIDIKYRPFFVKPANAILDSVLIIYEEE